MAARPLLLIPALALSLNAQVSRPPIVGVANITLRTNDMAGAQQFYGKFLGFAGEASFAVNDHQYIDVEPGLAAETQDRLVRIGFETTDARQLRDYVASRGVKVPDSVAPNRDGDLSFTIADPDGHEVFFVQYMPDSKRSRAVSIDAVSHRMIHVGVVIQDQAAADRLYRDILGFTDIWHGGMKDTVTDWVDMRVPDGTDWLEYMLNVHNPSPRTLGVMHHLALGVPSVQAGYEAVTARGYRSKEKPQIGRDGKWQFNMYDPNLTRVELMEPKPVRTPCCSPIRSD